MNQDHDREVLLRHSRTPSHAGDPSALTYRGSCQNPLCGDQVEVGVDLDGRNIVRLALRANGCGISTASASIMADLVDGKSVDSAREILISFQESLAGAEWNESLTTLRPFSRLRESPTRVPCALIGWFALKDALKSLE